MQPNYALLVSEVGSMGKLVNIDGVLLNPAAIDKAVPFTDEKSQNKGVRVFLRSGVHHDFGVTTERLMRLIRERQSVEIPE